MENLNSNYYYLVILLFLVIFLLKHLLQPGKRLPPSPLSLPIIGHLYLIKNSFHQTLTSLSTKYGPILHLRLGCRNLLVVSSPSAVEECFTKNDIVFANRPPTMVGDKFSFNYKAVVWAPYGYLWRALRRLMVIELFSFNSLQKSSALRSEEIGILIRSLFKTSNKNDTNGAKVNLSNWVFTFAFNIMTRTGTGKRCVSEEDIGTEKGKQIIEEIRELFFATLLVLNMCDFLPVLKCFGYKGIEKRMVSTHKKRNDFFNSLLDEFRQKKVAPVSVSESTTDRNKEKKGTLVETLLSLLSTADTGTGQYVADKAGDLKNTAEQAKHKAYETAEAAKQKASEKADEAYSKAGEEKQAAYSDAEKAKHTTSEKAGEAKETAADKAEYAKERIKEMGEKAEAETEEHVNWAKEKAKEGYESAKNKAGETLEKAKESVASNLESAKETAKEKTKEIKENIAGKKRDEEL